MIEENLVKLIDKRIQKYFQEHPVNRYYPAKVVEVLENGKRAKVRLASGDKGVPMEFYNKTNETLLAGDSVFVDAIGGNLTNGVIAYRFGEPNT